MGRRIYIYDTTLRDGAQTEGISFSHEDKLDIMERLDSFGMDFIEGGMPASNPKDLDILTKKTDLKNSTLVAFGSTRKPHKKASEDDGLNTMASCSCKWMCIFGKAWDFHVTKVLKTTLEENLRMVEDSISYLKSNGKRVIFDAEHFFDGYRDNPEYAMKVIMAASSADWIVLCDTNGGSMPPFVSKATGEAVSALGDRVGIHCHNDSDLAVACTLAAVDAGASMVQGTVNGIGERCGNTNLCSVIPNLCLKMGLDVSMDISELTALSYSISEIANIRHQPHMPYVGEKAFAHKGGMHVNALLKDPRTYEHITPETVGNKRRILISDMSGRASITEKIKELNINADEATVTNIKDRIKEMESIGYQYEGADASLRLLIERIRGGGKKPFSVQGFRLSIDGIGVTDLQSEATIKVEDNAGHVEHTASDGDGPVDALDKSLRKALSKFYPVIDTVRLTDYKVRVLDEKTATAARVRVLIRSTDGKSTWSTVGVSENVIEASLIALSDSMEYAITMTDKTGKGTQ